jgi:prophage maintenance system killer protein
MIKVSYPTPKHYLSIDLCEIIYNTYRNKVIKEGKASIPEFATRYESKLESILGSTPIKSEIKNYDVLQVSILYFVKLVKSQCFLDSNKRMAVLFTLVYLFTYGLEFTAPQQKLRNLALIISREPIVSFDEIEKALYPLFKKWVKVKKS